MTTDFLCLLRLNENLNEEQKERVSKSEDYQNLNWLIGQEGDVIIELPILSGNRLNVYQLEVFQTPVAQFDFST